MQNNNANPPHFVKPSKRKISTGESNATLSTRHLYVSGLGDAMNSTVEQIRTMFSSFGELDESYPWGSIDLPSEKRFCFVSFVDTSSAQRAYDSLKDSAANKGAEGCQRFICDFAEENIIIPVAEPVDCALSADVVIPGLHVIEDFITKEEEEKYLSVFDGEGAQWEDGISRRVQHYGFPFNYRTLMLDYNRPVAPIPKPMCDHLIERMLSVGRKMEKDNKHEDDEAIDAMPLSQMTVNEYEPGQGIASHIDTFNCFGPDIYIVSMCSGITMTLTHQSCMDASINSNTTATDDSENKDGMYRKKHVWLPPRSLLVLSGESRYEWGHCISSRMLDKVNGTIIPRNKRVSLTFRQAFQPNDPPRKLAASHVEMDHVFRVYDDIAVHWNHTRGKRKVHWARVKDFLEALPPGSLLADVGSGDGKYFGLNPGVVCIGCDRSWGLLQVSKDPANETFCCDIVTLPLTSNTFDATICVAVLHHLASKDRRIEAIRELLRITRPGGTILIQAWAKEQEEDSRLTFDEQDVLVPWRLQPRFFQEGQGEGKEKEQEQTTAIAPEADATVGKCEHVEEDEKGALVYKRYCHVYRRGEIEDICSYIPGALVVGTSWDKGNWVVEIEKKEVVEANLPVNPHKFACPEFVKRAEAAVDKVHSEITDASQLTVVKVDNQAASKAKAKKKAALAATAAATQT